MQKNIIQLLIGTILILLIPLALTIRDGDVEGVGWNWSPGDFVFAFVMIFGIGLAYLLIARKAAGNRIYKMAIGVALAATFLLVWINAAVGIIGDGPINMLYPVAILIGMTGAAIARLEPRGMSYALFATAVAVMLVPLIALLIGTPSFSPGVVKVFGLNAFFALSFVASGVLFRQASVSAAKEDHAKLAA
jgi:hypothetical protein